MAEVAACFAGNNRELVVEMVESLVQESLRIHLVVGSLFLGYSGHSFPLYGVQVVGHVLLADLLVLVGLHALLGPQQLHVNW